MATTQLECRPIQESEITAQDTRRVSELQNDFNLATGINVAGEDLLNRSFNPVFDRWHIEQAWESPDSHSEIIRQEGYIRENVRTNLMERMFAVETYGRFDIKDGHLRSESFSNESFGQILLRGANWRAQNGSREIKREGMDGELAGWLKINDSLVHGDVGTKIISLSPPGVVEKSSYDGRYIDIFEKVRENNEVFIKRLRIAVDMDWEAYRETALILDPGFFRDQDDRPLDAWYLSHPVIVTGIRQESLPLPKAAMSREEFTTRIYKPIEMSGLIEYYTQAIQRQPVNWIEVAKAFNTILTVSDKLKEGQSIYEIMAETMNIAISPRRDIVSRDNYRDSFMNPAAMVNMLGSKKVKQVGGGGCPPNRGYDFADTMTQVGSNPLENLRKEVFGNSVGKFGENETWEYHKGSCVVCKADPADVGPCDICKECEKKF